jgi:hypothetical protein
MRGRRTTTPTPVTGPVVHYEGHMVRRVLWLILIIQLLGVIVELL